MKKHLISVITLFVLAVTLPAQIPLSTSPYSVVERGPHHRVWQAVSSELGPSGETLWHTNSYVELESGACYQENGVWVDASEGIEVFPEGAVSRHTQHKVVFASNLNTKGAIDLLTGDGKRMRSAPIGLAYYDAATGQSAWIGGVKDCQGLVVGSNQVVFTNAFSNVLASVRYTVTKAGIEQDVIVEEDLPTPEEYGLSSETTRLEVVTEFYESPAPGKSTVVLKHYEPRLGQKAFVDPDFVDEQLDFGTMITGHGRAFKTSNQNGDQEGEQVGKRFGISGGRTFMIEGVEYQNFKQQFSQLPKSKTAIRTALNSATQERVYPPARQTVKTKTPLLMAQADFAVRKGVVIDYLLLNSTNNFTLRGDTTYFLTNNVTVTLSGTSVMEGGCVLKYSSGSALSFTGPVKTDTGAYRPVILTAKDDNTIGDTISGSTGAPSGYYGTGMTISADADLQYLYFKHLNTGVSYAANHINTLSHSKFYHTGTALSFAGGTNYLRNVLFDTLNSCLSFASGVNVCSVEHATANTIATAFASGVTSSLYVTNSLFAQCTFNGYSFTSDHCATSSSTNGVFQGVMNGGSYLADNTYRNQGTTNINANLLKDLRTRTTYVPVMLTNTISTAISVDTVLNPQAQRDTDIPDLGFHYDPVDYMVGNLYLTNATLTLTNGVAVGYFGSFGFILQTGSVLVSQGMPDRMNRLTHYQWVQDRSDLFDPTSGQRAVWMQSGTGVNMFLRFTALNAKSRSASTFFGLSYLNRMAVTDCQFTHGSWVFSPTSTMGALCWTNNLCKRMTLTVVEGYNGNPASLNFLCYNNNFIESTLTMNNNVATYPWTIYDNLFDNCTLTCANTSGGSGYNGYVNMGTTLGGSQNVTLSTFNYATGSYGGFYQSSTNLINKGSRNAAIACLYHYTTQTNNTKELGSVVDIGFHYVAADANGNPNDQDGDGMPDYLEDRNGNGTADSGETDWATNNDGMGASGALQVFTPVK